MYVLYYWTEVHLKLKSLEKNYLMKINVTSRENDLFSHENYRYKFDIIS